MSWHGNRHSGGVKGTRLQRAACPVCGRDTAGGNCNREHTQIVLKPHLRTADGKTERCPGSKERVYWRGPIADMIARREDAELSGCPACGSDDYSVPVGEDGLPDYASVKRCDECGEEWL